MDLKSELLKSIWYAFTSLDVEHSGKVSKSQLKVLSHNLYTALNIPHDPVALEEHFQDNDNGPVSNRGYMPYLNNYILAKATEGTFSKETFDELCWMMTSKKNLKPSIQQGLCSQTDCFRLFCLFNLLSEDRYPLVIIQPELDYLLKKISIAMKKEHNGKLVQALFTQETSLQDGMTVWEFLEYLSAGRLMKVDNKGTFSAALNDVYMEMYHNIIKKGFMLKKGNVRRNWQERWFVLKPGIIVYYVSEDLKEKKGEAHLDGNCTVETIPDKEGKPYLFCVKTPGRTYEISVSDQKQRLEWMNAIQTAARLKAEGKSSLHQELKMRRRELREITQSSQSSQEDQNNQSNKINQSSETTQSIQEDPSSQNNQINKSSQEDQITQSNQEDLSSQKDLSKQNDQNSQSSQSCQIIKSSQEDQIAQSRQEDLISQKDQSSPSFQEDQSSKKEESSLSCQVINSSQEDQRSKEDQSSQEDQRSKEDESSQKDQSSPSCQEDESSQKDQSSPSCQEDQSSQKDQSSPSCQEDQSSQKDQSSQSCKVTQGSKEDQSNKEDQRSQNKQINQISQSSQITESNRSSQSSRNSQTDPNAEVEQLSSETQKGEPESTEPGMEIIDIIQQHLEMETQRKEEDAREREKQEKRQQELERQLKEANDARENMAADLAKRQTEVHQQKERIHELELTQKKLEEALNSEIQARLEEERIRHDLERQLEAEQKMLAELLLQKNLETSAPEQRGNKEAPIPQKDEEHISPPISSSLTSAVHSDLTGVMDTHQYNLEKMSECQAKAQLMKHWNVQLNSLMKPITPADKMERLAVKSTCPIQGQALTSTEFVTKCQSNVTQEKQFSDSQLPHTEGDSGTQDHSLSELSENYRIKAEDDFSKKA